MYHTQPPSLASLIKAQASDRSLFFRLVRRILACQEPAWQISGCWGESCYERISKSHGTESYAVPNVRLFIYYQDRNYKDVRTLGNSPGPVMSFGCV